MVDSCKNVHPKPILKIIDKLNFKLSLKKKQVKLKTTNPDLEALS